MAQENNTIRRRMYWYRLHDLQVQLEDSLKSLELAIQAENMPLIKVEFNKFKTAYNASIDGHRDEFTNLLLRKQAEKDGRIPPKQESQNGGAAAEHKENNGQ